MCTATWWIRTETAEFRFNRDEQHSRPQAELPQVQKVENDLLAVHPRDPEGGGSWIFVNQAGLMAAILNYYEIGGVRQRSPDQLSRGRWLLSLAGCRTKSAVDRIWASRSHQQCLPFHLLLLAPAEVSWQAWQYTWDGRQSLAVHREETCGLCTTSSLQPAETAVARGRQFSRLTPSSESLAAFHNWRDPKDDGRSVLMHRMDARTVSLSCLRLEPGKIVFDYAPCPQGAAPGPWQRWELPRLP